MRLSALWIGPLLLPLALASGPLVTLDYGMYQGIDTGNLSTFLGLRYAAPAARFTRPSPPTAFSGTQLADTNGAACPQQALTSVGTGPAASLPTTYTSMSDDCLTLSVFAPKSATHDSNLPVFFWIYGGGFEVGFYADNDLRPFVERSILKGEPVIVVTPNYRVSAYGFLGGKEVGQAGLSNLGLRDQIFALEWVQQHISAFGGDPRKVVVGGVSAGSMSIATLLLNNNHFKAQDLFRGAFMESGAQIPTPALDASQHDYDSLVAANNCTDSTDTLNCLRQVPLGAFSATVNQTADVLSYRSINILWRPRVDGDLIVEDPFRAVKHGSFAPLPFIIGDVDDEGTDFMISSTNITTNEEFIGYLPNFLPSASAEQIDKLSVLYPDDPTKGSPFDTGDANQLTPQSKRIAAFLGDYLFQSERRYFLEHASRRQSTWSYLVKRGKSTPFFGSAHGGDVSIWLPTPATTDFVVTDSLIHFINTLNPNNGRFSQWPTWNTRSASGNNSLLTLSDPAVVNITADDFRVEQIKHMQELLLNGAAY
ncbi:Carboxylic ester hydrolase [Mycena indigotica]|uniref:Carboxylic ester hydrolase n=1 Tax=Mycena indigotica TaxID=2126181 RepID=A0A8H6S2Q3_9AGAR|nr:Carboxylic ester hydrolase [Mycena indigotica]KAF7290757.1 Carboxylic ester hydrolase [Mycena indigotica]